MSSGESYTGVHLPIQAFKFEFTDSQAVICNNIEPEGGISRRPRGMGPLSGTVGRLPILVWCLEVVALREVSIASIEGRRYWWNGLERNSNESRSLSSIPVYGRQYSRKFHPLREVPQFLNHHVRQQ